jgi:pimeloyl-ACP methyl ester carboxylesterase
MKALAVSVLALAFAAPAHATSYVGTYRLPTTAEPVAITVELSGARAAVALGPGHAGRQVVPVKSSRFTLPGGVRFDLRTRAVTQGKLHGRLELKRGSSRVLNALGLYRGPNGTGVAIVQAQGLPTWLVELPSGDVHGLNASLTTAGSRLADTSGAPVAVRADTVTWDGVRYTRAHLRQREVRVGAIAATLTIPDGAGPFAAAVMTHGSGLHARDEFQVFAAYCELLGIAVIADDKRGIGESQGTYPGEAATPHTLDVLARDAQAEARYLASLPQIDKAQIGVLGDSQAGWVIALAAAREKAFRWAVPLVGPTVTVDESDAWGTLAGKGESPPSGSPAEMTAQARAARGGFDPAPHLRKLAIPVHWVFADDDRNVPTALCVERLEQLKHGHDFTWDVVHATHTLLELPNGLNESIPRSRGFARELFPSVGAFLRRIGVAT